MTLRTAHHHLRRNRALLFTAGDGHLPRSFTPSDLHLHVIRDERSRDDAEVEED